MQLALNGAEHVDAIDIQRSAVANTLANAFRNGVSERVSGKEVDLYMFEPERRYDHIGFRVGRQLRGRSFEEPSGHRSLDYWGRNLVDRLLKLLPWLLADDGVALVLQLSILSRLRTAELLDELDLEARVVDYGFFPFSPLVERNQPQIERVERASDAYHLTLGDERVMVAYLLEITRR